MLRAGDLVYLTVPGGGRQVFEFDPVPVNPADAYGGSATGLQYRANFIAMDGSGATLSFNFANFQPFNPYQVDSEVPQTLYYNARDDEFGYTGATGGNAMHGVNA